MITRFSDLPDSIEPSELAAIFLEFLQCEASVGKIAIYELAELAERQWHTYELLEESLRESIDLYISRSIKNYDFDAAKKAIYVIGCLGLRKSFGLLPDCEKQFSQEDEKHYIRSAINELGNSVEDPFSGMR